MKNLTLEFLISFEEMQNFAKDWEQRWEDKPFDVEIGVAELGYENTPHDKIRIYLDRTDAFYLTADYRDEEKDRILFAYTSSDFQEEKLHETISSIIDKYFPEHIKENKQTEKEMRL